MLTTSLMLVTTVAAVATGNTKYSHVTVSSQSDGLAIELGVKIADVGTP